MTVTGSNSGRDLRSAFGLERYERALGTSRAWLLRSVLDQIASGDATRLASLADADALLVQQALLVAELMAIEHLDDAEAASTGSTVLRKACSDAFYLLRALPEQIDPDARRKTLLRLSCYGILGDRSADIRRWLREQGLPDLPPEQDAWPRRVFGTVADSFLRIARKDGWPDIHEVARGIAELRRLQTQFEQDFLAGVSASAQVSALELVSLYHLAKAVELLGTFCGKGSPKDIVSELKFHYFRAIRAASTGGLVELDVLLRWMRAASIQVAQNSIWWLLRSFNSRISEHVRHLASEDVARPLLELLPPQRRALLEDGLLDPAHRAVVVQMPTSSGKTLLAEFRILQAINSFPGCWIAYLVPTRALVNQIALRLRRDLEPLGLTVESAAPVQEVDVFEEEWLTSAEAANVVVTTPEKLDLVIRGAKRRPAQRPLGLVILDEAHNIGETERGVRAELLLAMLNQEYPDAQFLLLTPFVPNGQELAVWLDDQRSRAITVLETMVIDVLDRGWDLNLTSLVRHDPRWASFAQYLAHAYRQAGDHDRFVADTEKILRATWGYRRLSSSRPAAAEQLVDATRQYAETLQRMGPGVLSLVDSTGFSGETLMEILQRRDLLPSTADGWSPSELFRSGTPTLAGLFEILIGVRELQLDVPAGSQHRHLAEVLSMWVEGRPVGEIAAQHFQTEGADMTASITQCCRQLFQRFSQAGAWGLGALQALTGIDTSGLTPEQSEAFRSVPAMVFYGVPTVNGVLMRALGVPRSIAVPLGDRFAGQQSGGVGPRVVRARTWLKDLPSETWDEVKPAASRMSGDDYRRVWRVLNGMGGR